MTLLPDEVQSLSHSDMYRVGLTDQWNMTEMIICHFQSLVIEDTIGHSHVLSHLVGEAN